VIGHSFNPPHLVPLVEIVGGAKTSVAGEIDQTSDTSFNFSGFQAPAKGVSNAHCNRSK